MAQKKGLLDRLSAGQLTVLYRRVAAFKHHRVGKKKPKPVTVFSRSDVLEELHFPSLGAMRGKNGRQENQ